jgi:hypothetical protein
MSKLKLYCYGQEPKNFHPKEGTEQYDYWYFTKYNSNYFAKIEFDGKVFTCYHRTITDYKLLNVERKIHSTYDNGFGKKYVVKHKIGID